MKEEFEFCNSCMEYTQHRRTAPTIIRCKNCGHGQWTSYTPLNNDIKGKLK